MTNALDDLFAQVKAENRAALIGYIPAGFPTTQQCIEVVKAMVAGGVDAIEIGFPYSDPVMDGPIIQAAADRSLKNGTGASDVFETVAQTAALGLPTVIMTYWNPIERYGVTEFAARLKEAGGAGVITPDLTIEESAQWKIATSENGIHRIYVVAQSTLPKRLVDVTNECGGFIYAASLMGVTGTRTKLSEGAQALVSRIREVSTTAVAVGLGVSTKEQAHQVAAYADGVIVGSAFIRLVQEAPSFNEGLLRVQELAADLADGVRR